MSLETLLEAAKYIELQEQRNYQVSLRPPPSSLSTSDGHNNFINNNSSNRNYNNSTNINNNSISNSRNSHNRNRHHAQRIARTSQTLVSPVNSTTIPSSSAAATTAAAAIVTGTNFITNGIGNTTMGPSSGTNLIANNNQHHHHHNNSNHNSHILGSGNSHDYAMTLSSNDGRNANIGTTSSTTSSNANVSLSSLSTVGGVSASAVSASAISSTSPVTGAIPVVVGGTPLIPNGVVAGVNGLASVAEDSSQSSLNLSSSGYLSGGSANSSVGAISGNLNISNSSTSSLTGSSGSSGGGLYGHLNGTVVGEHHLQHQQQPQQQQQQQTVTIAQAVATAGRRRTTSTNSNGQAGVREVHNKLEKHRRAHLKECFEQLKIQLPLRDEEKKKTSNLSILGAACRHVMTLKRKERELEQEVEKLAKEKIIFQKRILSLKRELASKHDNFDFSSVVSDGDIGIIPSERDNLSETLSSGRGSARYSSSSSLSSTTTMPSPSGSNGILQTSLSRAISPMSNSHLHNSKSISPTGISVPLSLTTKPRDSPTPSIPSPLPNYVGILPPSSPIVSSSGSPSASSISSLSSSPPIGSQSPSTAISLKTPNVPNGIKISASAAIISSSSSSTLSSNPPVISSSSLAAVATTINPSSTQSLPSSSLTIPSTSFSSVNAVNCTIDNSILTATPMAAVTAGIPLNLNATTSHNVQIFHAAKDLTAVAAVTGKNGICRKNNVEPMTSVQHLSSPSGLIVTSSGTVSAKDDNDLPARVLQLVNSIPSHVTTNGGLVLSRYQMFSPPQDLQMFGAGGLATIELSTPTVQSQQRNPQPSPPTSTTTTGTQLHKLLVNGTTMVSTNGTNCTPITSVSSELGRLPGGAELNILPTSKQPNGKLAIVNRGGITLKDAVVVAPIQSGTTSLSGLTPIVVSQGQGGNNLAHIIRPQIAQKMNLPIINTQYLSPIKPMVVAVTSNPTPSNLSTVPVPAASAVARAAAATANGGVS